MAFIKHFNKALEAGNFDSAVQIATRKPHLERRLGMNGLEEVVKKTLVGLTKNGAADCGATIQQVCALFKGLGEEDFYSDQAAMQAARLGNLHFLQWHYDTTQAIRAPARVSVILRAALGAGQTDAAQALMDAYGLQTLDMVKIFCPPGRKSEMALPEWMHAGALGLMVQRGHVHAISWYADLHPDCRAVVVGIISRLIYQAVVHGKAPSLSMLKYLDANYVDAQGGNVYDMAGGAMLVETALMRSASGDVELECARWLIDRTSYGVGEARNIRKNKKRNQRTILIHAATAGLPHVVALLADIGLDGVDALFMKGEAIYQAIQGQHGAVLEVFLRHPDDSGYGLSKEELRSALNNNYITCEEMKRYLF